MSAIAGVVVGLVIGAGGASALLWPRLQKAQQAQQQLSQELQRQDQRLSAELDQQGRRYHDQRSQLEAQLAELQTELTAAQATLQQTQQDLAASRADYSASDLKVQTLQAQIVQQRQQILSLQQCAHNLEQRLSRALQAAEENRPATSVASQPAFTNDLPADSGPAVFVTPEEPSDSPTAAVAAPQDILDRAITASTEGIALDDILQQVRDRKASNRANTALALGAIAPTSSPADLLRILKALTQLGRDPNAEVRLAVVQSLADLRSPKVLPLLRQALRDADSEVVKAASAAIAPFRGALRPPTRKVAKKAKSRSRRSGL